MTSIGIIAIYLFRRWPWPRWAELFVETCRRNPTVQFFLVTNFAEARLYRGPNVEVRHLDLAAFTKLASRRLGFEVDIRDAYKLTDLRPAHGVIFEDLIGGYDFFGHCDMDLVFGDIRAFMTEELLARHDVIFARREFPTGHFSLFRRGLSRIYERSRDYRKVFTSPWSFAFEECGWGLHPRLLLGASFADVAHEARVDSLMHLLARSPDLRVHYETLCDEYLPSVDSNIHGALNIFEGCRPNSMHPKGLPGVQIAVGNHFMNNTYAITKSTAERFALMFNRELKCHIAVVRGLNAYGEDQKHKPVRKITPNFLVRALRGQPIEIFGDGEQVMDMIYVKDVAEVLIRALVRDHGCYDKAFEAGSGRPTTVNEIARIVNELTGNKGGVNHLPMRAGEPDRSVVLGDPSSLKPLGLGKKDLTPLEVGLERTIKWYRDNYDLNSL